MEEGTGSMEGAVSGTQLYILCTYFVKLLKLQRASVVQEIGHPRLGVFREG